MLLDLISVISAPRTVSFIFSVSPLKGYSALFKIVLLNFVGTGGRFSSIAIKAVNVTISPFLPSSIFGIDTVSKTYRNGQGISSSLNMVRLFISMSSAW